MSEKPDIPTLNQLRQQASTAHQSGNAKAAWTHLEQAKALDPDGTVPAVRFLEADFLGHEGRLPEAQTVLQQVAAKHPGNPWVYFKLARLGRQAGDPAGAQAHLDTALSYDPDGAIPGLRLLQADLAEEGGETAKAEAALQAALAANPGMIAIYQRLARLANKRNDRTAAGRYLAQAGTQDPDGKVAALALHRAEFLQEEGQFEPAKAVLEEMLLRHPEHVQGHQRLAQLARLRNDPGAVREHLEAALALDGTHLGMQLELAQQDVAEGGLKAAMNRLEQLRAKHGPMTRILLPLSLVYRRAGQGDREEQCLQEAVNDNPTDPGLLRHLFGVRATLAASETLTTALERLRPRVGDALVDDLHLRALLQTRDYAEALRLMRAARSVQRTPADALGLATALFGAHHYQLGLRYLRFCLRRWPGHRGFLELYVQRGLRLGQDPVVIRAVERATESLSDHAMLGHRLLIAGFRGDLEGAVAAYTRLLKLGQVTQPQRDILAKLIYTQLDPAKAEALAGQIGHPMAETGKPLHRCGLAGLMTLEYDLECQALADSGYYDDPADWVRARGHSTVPAIRLIDAWRASAPADPPDSSQAAVVPRQIIQYWNETDVPPALEAMIASWSKAPGYTHRLMDRTAALSFLRESGPPDTVRAFLLAQNPAQEADFLRLTLLAREGGIWADADDHLYGDLGQVLGDDPRGLILYREPLGGAVGNNFMAAPAGHPVVVYAARLAKQALLQRANEIAWNKTGPGLLTRALAQFLVQTDPEIARRRITILDWPRIAHQIATNNPVQYKTQAGYWENEGARMPRDGVWKGLLAALD